MNDIVNIGSHIECSILDLAKKVIEMTSSSSKIIHLSPLEEGDMTRRKPDNSKMMKVLGRELTSVEHGFGHLIKEFQSKSANNA